MHLQSKRQKFTRASVAQLRDDYWALSDQQRAELKKVGQEATAVDLPAFSRRARRQRRQKGPATEMVREQDVALVGNFSALLSSFMANGCIIARAQDPPGARQAYAMSLSDPWVWSQDGRQLADVLRLFCRWMRLERKRVAEPAPDEEEGSREAAQQLLQQRLGLAEMRDSIEWHSYPHTCHELSGVWSAATLPEHEGGSVPSLAHAWDERHTGIPKSSWTHSKDPGVSRHAKCLFHGHCHCKGRGCKVAHFRSQVLVCLRDATQNGLLPALKHGHLILHFQGVLLNQVDGVDAQHGHRDDIFFHIAFYLNQPVRPTLLRMQLFQGQEASQLPDLHMTIRDNADIAAHYWKFRSCTLADHEGIEGLPLTTLWSLLDSLSLDKAWAGHLWHLSERKRAVYPQVGAVFAYPTDCKPRLLWDPRSWPPRRSRKRLHEHMVHMSSPDTSEVPFKDDDVQHVRDEPEDDEAPDDNNEYSTSHINDLFEGASGL